jgi:prolyl-tRNA synthetase
MKYSKFFGKTIKGKVDVGKFDSSQLLVRGGFIRESVAGRYFFLPLGWRVHEKIKAIIKEEMDNSGAQEMISPVLHPLELWQETNRTNTAGFELMKVTDRRGAEFALGGTAEEMFVDVVRKFQLSYRDLPFNIYQFSTKFRDELRARGGLLRVREFVMKDAYSFHASEEDFKKEYDSMAQAYTNIFEKLGLSTLMVEADNGYIGGEYCHEFQVEHELGEGRFFVSEDGKYIAHEDVAKFVLDPVNPDDQIKDFEIVDQPDWVKTMEDFMKHYKLDKRYFLKNVVYKNTQGDIVIATIRGDLEVNKTKLEHLLNLVGQLEDATDQDLKDIGTKTGHVHSWGHEFIKPTKAKSGDRNCKVIYVGDSSLYTVKNFIGGQKEESTDSINVNYGRDFKHEIEGDIAMAEEGMTAPDNHGKLIQKRGIEVGNIFQLGHHYTTLMQNATFTDQDGKQKPYYMGCYGLGLGRTMAAVVEKYHDEKGIVWPEVIAPFEIHLISLAQSEQKAQEVYEALLEKGIEVLWDDRDLSAGEKFADADLIGIPVRLVISQKTGDKIEYKLRNSEESQLLSMEELTPLLLS